MQRTKGHAPSSPASLGAASLVTGAPTFRTLSGPPKGAALASSLSGRQWAAISGNKTAGAASGAPSRDREEARGASRLAIEHGAARRRHQDNGTPPALPCRGSPAGCVSVPAEAARRCALVLRVAPPPPRLLDVEVGLLRRTLRLSLHLLPTPPLSRSRPRLLVSVSCCSAPRTRILSAVRQTRPCRRSLTFCIAPRPTSPCRCSCPTASRSFAPHTHALCSAERVHTRLAHFSTARFRCTAAALLRTPQRLHPARKPGEYGRVRVGRLAALHVQLCLMLPGARCLDPPHCSWMCRGRPAHRP
jgi:hypothetical protein